MWCVLRSLNPKEHNSEILDKKLKLKENTLNMEGIEYHVSLKDLNKFEKQNPNIAITVLGYNRKSVYPLRNSDNAYKREHNIILMLIKEEGIHHYCLVKNLSRLLASQVSKAKRKEYFCTRCFNTFRSQEVLFKHLEYCKEHDEVKINMPKEGTILKFKNYDRKERVPFIVYADFECFIKPIQTCEPNPESSYTKQYQKHEPTSFCYYIKCFDDKVYEPKKINYTGKNAAQKFMKMLEEDIKIITNTPEKIIFGEKEKENLTRKLNAGYAKKNSKMIKIKRLETIAILLVDIEELYTTNVI